MVIDMVLVSLPVPRPGLAMVLPSFPCSARRWPMLCYTVNSICYSVVIFHHLCLIELMNIQRQSIHSLHSLSLDVDDDAYNMAA